ncbi:MAG: ABC transporter permease subunit [Armatimonadota bacterium]|nr:ABC transporter permease subunit [Armatimonadota bacterium]MDR7519059.1 ABC transporter permease subunit [Armatimonadota bacterium]MDR7551154.1 ABC transporter permease subunit [Armatimonadota bacterium]
MSGSRPDGRIRRSRRRFAAGEAGGAALGLVLVLAIAAPVLAPYDPQQPVGGPVSPPDARFRLGTNALGQDLLSQVLYGARTSVLVGVLVAGASTILSAAVGTAAGMWQQGRRLLLVLVDLFLAIPGIPVVVLLVVFAGPGFWPLVVAMVLIGWAGFARIVAAQVRVTMAQAYVEAARAAGATASCIVRSSVLPEIAPILATKFLLTVRWAILLEAALGLLGLGDPARPSWGLILHQAFAHPLLFVTDAWAWWAGPPAAAIVLTSLALMAVGQDLDAWLNPQAATVR